MAPVETSTGAMPILPSAKSHSFSVTLLKGS